MIEEMKQGNTKLSLFRGVLEAVIVAALIWTGSSLVSLRVENAQLSGKLDAVVQNTADLPVLRNDVITLKVEVRQLQADMSEQKKLRNLRR